MLDLIVFIKADGPNIRQDNMYETLVSLKHTIGNCNYGFYIVTNPFLINSIRAAAIDDKIVDIKLSNPNVSWAYDYNMFVSEYKDKTKWILISHDDLIVRTPNFINKTFDAIKGKEDQIGWITFTSDYYYTIEGLPIPCTARSGLAIDRNNAPYLYECHNLTREHYGQTQNFLHLLDMPESGKLVKIHAPMSSLFMVSSKNMQKIGPCEDWTLYTMLIDEDWGFESLRNNLISVWIPDIFYTHPLRKPQRPTGNKWEAEAHAAFIKKWGFDIPLFDDNVIKEIQQQYKDSLIPWSSYYRTYEWQYL